MKERNETGQENPQLHEFEVFYIKSVSTWRNDWEQHGKEIMTFESKPIGEERRQLERKMEEDFINSHRKQRRNLADISYKITRIRAIPPGSSSST
jgi:hypothetical protein